MTNNKNLLVTLLQSLKCSQVVRELSNNGIRLSTMGWSEYYVIDNQLMYHHHYGDDEYTEVVSSIDDITLRNEYEDEKSSFEYYQEITSDIVKVLKSLL